VGSLSRQPHVLPPPPSQHIVTTRAKWIPYIFVNVSKTKRLPADAGRFVGVAFDVAKYDVVGDIAAGRAEVPPGPETAAPVALADVGKLLLDFA
jgi:hypothetical protein